MFCLFCFVCFVFVLFLFLFLFCLFCYSNFLSQLFSDGADVLELGSGIGVCGIAVRRLTDAKSVTLTDVVDALPLMERNAAEAKTTTTTSTSSLRCALFIEALQWGVDAVSAINWRTRSFDIIVGSDLLYQLESHDALFETLEHFFTLNPRCVFVLSHKKVCLNLLLPFVDLCSSHFVSVNCESRRSLCDCGAPDFAFATRCARSPARRRRNFDATLTRRLRCC